MDKTLIVRSAVGRVARVGDLYDFRSETFTNISIFKESPPKSTIQIKDDLFTEIQCINSDKLSDKFDKLNITTEMKASIMGGLVLFEGHGNYFSHEKQSRKAVQSSFFYSKQTKLEQLDLFNKELQNYYSSNALDINFGTHIVVGVSWGANTIVTLEHLNTKNEDKNIIQTTLNKYLHKLASQINENGSIDNDEDATVEHIDEDYLSITVFGDILPHGKQPKSFAETIVYAKNISHMLQIANQGKGKQIKYKLIPISILVKHLNFTIPNSLYLPKLLDVSSINSCIALFDEISETRQQIYDIEQDLLSHKYCVLYERIVNLAQIKNKFDNAKASLRKRLAKAIIGFRSGNSDVEKLEKISSDFLNSETSPQTIRTVLSTYNVINNKILFADALKQEGVFYIGNDPSIELNHLKAQYDDIYILYFGSNFTNSYDKLWSDNMHFYLDLINSTEIIDKAKDQNSSLTFIAVDLEIRPEISENEGVGKGDRICHYKEGKYITFDLMTDLLKIKLTCYAKSNSEYTICNTPNKRVILQLRCPGTINGNCEANSQTWICANCNNILFYCFDDYFYCLCGRAPFTSFIFKCNSEMHDFTYFEKKHLTKLLQLIGRLKEINILILGVTGVGKSTWINAICNYMSYPTLESAAKGKLVSVTSTSFEMTDDEDKVHYINFGSDKNEVHKTGQSVTQQPKAYEFSLGDSLFRLIDTPGIGDTRGQDYDKVNVDAILSYLSKLDCLNGICILLKPNESRLDVFFEYCLKELLTHLHKSACKNIVFCFTNSRGTYYKPGDTRGPLSQLLIENKIEIKLSAKTMYCMDNESFRFLCAVNDGIKFKDNIKKSFSESWNISVEETNRLFFYIKCLSPHPINDTLTINSARKNIFLLTKPIADISQNIQRNISVAEDKKIEILYSKMSEAKLAKSLYIDTFELVPIELGHPRTVCTNKKRVTYENKETKYVTHCHKHCHLKGVRKEIIGNPEIQKCNAMNGDLSCKVCSCKWDQHMHITYEQISRPIRVIDLSVKTQILDKESARKQKEIFIENIEQYCKEQKEEQVIIMKVSVKFGCFLFENAITPYNDALGRYLQHLKEKEEEKAAISKDYQTLKRMESMLREYEQEVEALKQAMSEKNAGKMDPKEINLLMKQLFSLKHNGNQLREAMDKESSINCRMLEYDVDLQRTLPLIPMNHNIIVKSRNNIMKGLINHFF